MNALVLEGPNRFCYQERVPVPCGPDQVRVKIEAVAICGSDAGAILGKNPLFTYPRVLGHEAAGTVESVGSRVTGLQPGDRVCLMPCISCGSCRACRRGKPNCCQSLKLYGVQEDGALQEYLTVPEKNLLKIPFDAPAQAIAAIEPLTIGAHAAGKLHLTPEDRVLVIGAGPIGVSCALNVQTYGAAVYLADTNEARRNFVKNRFSLEVLDPMGYDYAKEIAYITQGDNFDAVIDTTAVKASMDSAWRYITQGGQVVYVGICGSSIALEGLPFHLKEPTLGTTRNSTPEDYQRVLRFWQLGLLDPEKLVTHTAPFQEAAQAIPAWISPGSGVFKGVVQFPK